MAKKQPQRRKPSPEYLHPDNAWPVVDQKGRAISNGARRIPPRKRVTPT